MCTLTVPLITTRSVFKKLDFIEKVLIATASITMFFQTLLKKKISHSVLCPFGGLTVIAALDLMHE